MALGHLYQVSSACLLCRGAYTGEYEGPFRANYLDGRPGVPVNAIHFPRLPQFSMMAPITLQSLMVGS